MPLAVHDADHLAFASELKALLQDPAVKRVVRLDGLDDYFSFGAVWASSQNRL